MSSIQPVWETHSLKSQTRSAKCEGNHGILWGQRVGPGVDSHGVSGCGQRARATADSPGAAAWPGDLVPLRLLFLSRAPSLCGGGHALLKAISIPILSPPPVGGNHSLHNLSLCPPRQLLPSG